MIKKIYLGIGILLGIIGVVGIAIPILPTTPFIIVSVALIAKGSDKVHNGLINSGFYQKHIEPIRNKKQMNKKDRIITLITVTIFLTVAIIIAPYHHLKILLGIVLLCHYYFLGFRRPKAKK
ncbi:MAG: YbaN family protein [Anaerovoracaceae bacterium]